MRSILFGILLVLGRVASAHADSDGSYCVGRGYLAAEFRSFSTPGLSGMHLLKILRFDEEQGPRWTGEVVVEEFQTHTVLCGATNIKFEGVGETGKRAAR